MNNSSYKGMTSIILSCAIVAVAFLVIVFAVPFIWDSTFWVCFASIWIAIALVLLANIYVIATSRSMTSAVYKISLSTVSIIYLIVTGIVSLAIMAVGAVPFWIALIVEVVLLALCLLGFIGGAAGADLIESDGASTAYSKVTIDTLRSQSRALIPMASDPSAKKALTELSEKLLYTDPMSSDATVPFDQQLITLMGGIDAALRQGEWATVVSLCNDASITIDQRAAICRASK